MKQLEIDWNKVVHTRENNRHSEGILFNQYDRLSNNCRKVLNALRSGGKWSGRRMMIELNITEYRRRIADLKDAGLEIQEETLKNGTKQWWI